MRAWVAMTTLALAVALAAPAAAQQTPAPETPTPTPSAAPTTTTPPPPVITVLTRPKITGKARYQSTLKVAGGRWSVPVTLRYRWLRDGKAVAKATGARYAVGPADVGHRLAVRVTASRTGYPSVTVTSARTAKVAHRVARKRTVTYQVRTRGKVTASLRTFRRQVQETYDDPRGWRSTGTAFKQVAKGGDFTVVLSTAGKVPTFSSACSRQWSCRVGRYVVINQDRWLHASPAWRKRGGSLRDYRHMVVNHETGHWFGKPHTTCPAKGAKAPVMMQQSKGLRGCTFNPWPRAGERSLPRFR